jgi:CRISPR/Cas system-associated exonuclease Cas4 (RecB family)
MAELIYSVDQVFTSYFAVGQKYNIPDYQRGYKWNSQPIKPNENLKFTLVFESLPADCKAFDLVDIILEPNVFEV